MLGLRDGVEDPILNVSVFGVFSGNEGETLRLCYLHMGATGWPLCGPSSVPGHHRHLQLQ